jgi:hypothetical protein
MDPDVAYTVPAKQKVEAPVIWLLDLGHIKRMAIPAFLLLLLWKPFSAFLPTGAGLPYLFVSVLIVAVAVFVPFGGVPLEVYLLNLGRYLASPRKFYSTKVDAKGKPASHFIPDLRIDNGIVMVPTDSGRADYVAIVHIRPANYHQMRRQDKASALSVLGSLLNRAEGPVQFVTDNHPFESVPYFRRFRKAYAQHGKGFKRLTTNFMRWMEGFVRTNNILDRDYYLIIKKDAVRSGDKPLQGADRESVERATQYLTSFSHSICNQFSGVGATCKVLDTREAFDLLQRRFSPKAHTPKDALKDGLLGKGELQGKLGELKVPDITIGPDFLQLGDKKTGQDWIRTITVKRYPERLPVAWLTEILAMRERVDVSMHVQPKDSGTIQRKLQNMIVDMNHKIEMDHKNGKPTQLLEEKLLALREQYSAVANRQTNFYEVTVWFTLHATKRKELGKLTQDVKTALRGLGFDPFVEKYTQHKQWMASMPLAQNPIRRHEQTYDTTLAAISYPFITSTMKHPDGVLMGFHASTGQPYIIDKFSSEFPNFTTLVIGASGSGKSYSAKTNLLRERMLHPEAWTILIDPLAEFGGLTRLMGGQIVAVGRRGVCINPFDLAAGTGSKEKKAFAEDMEQNAYYRALAFLEEFFATLFRDMETIERSLLRLAVKEAYNEKGINQAESTHFYTPPTLSDLLRILQAHGGKEDDASQKTAWRALATHLESELTGAVGFLDGQTNVDLKKNLVCFNLKSLDRAWFPLYMFTILHYIEGRVFNDITTQKTLLIDEAWILMDKPGMAQTIAELSRHLRHYRCSMWLLTQTASSFTKDEFGEAVLQNCSQIYLMKQSAVNDKVREAMHLGDEDCEYLSRMGGSKDKGYSEFFFISGPNKNLLHLYTSEPEHLLLTTDPEELDRMSKGDDGPTPGKGPPPPPAAAGSVKKAPAPAKAAPAPTSAPGPRPVAKAPATTAKPAARPAAAPAARPVVVAKPPARRQRPKPAVTAVSIPTNDGGRTTVSIDQLDEILPDSDAGDIFLQIAAEGGKT